MRCPSDETLFGLASGEPGRLAGWRLLRHIERCRSCLTRWNPIKEEARVGLSWLAEDRSAEGGPSTSCRLAPSDPAGLRRRVLTAVSADREKRTREGSGARRPVLLPLAAAVAGILLLAFIGSRFFDGPGSIGNLDDSRGTFVSASAGEQFERVEAVSRDLSAGDVLLVVPGGYGTVQLKGAGKLGAAGRSDGSGAARIEDEALVVLGDAGDGAEIFVARGSVTISSRPGGEVAAYADKARVRVDGEARLTVAPRNPAVAFETARERSFRVRRHAGVEILDTASAGADTPGSPPAIRVTALVGHVSLDSGRILVPAGQESSFLAGTGWTAPVDVSTDDPLQRPQLTNAEITKAEEFFALMPDPVMALLEAASELERSVEDRGLAIWLLGELGDDRIAGQLEILAGANNPLGVRAAAVRSLALLGVCLPVEKALEADEPAVAEAAAQALARMGTRRSLDRLEATAADVDRPDFLRALCAAGLHSRGRVPPFPALLSILASPDPDAAAIASSLMRREAGPSDEQALLRIAAEGAPREAAVALERLGGLRIEGAEEYGRRGLGSTEPILRAAALEYLFAVSPDDADRAITDGTVEAALGSKDGIVRLAALRALLSTDGEVPAVLEMRIEEIWNNFDSSLEEWRAAIALSRPSASRLAAMCTTPGVPRHLLRAALDELSLTSPVVRDLDFDGMLGLTTHADEEVRSRAWAVLFRADAAAALAAAGPVDAEDLLPALIDSVQQGRSDTATSRLAELSASSPDPETRRKATWRLMVPARRGEETAWTALFAVLQRDAESPSVTAAAAAALAEAVRGAGREHERFDVVAARVRERTGTDHARALLALQPPIDEEEIRRVLRDGDADAGRLVLIGLPPARLRDFRPEIARHLTSPNPWVRCAALAAFEGGEAALERLRDSEPIVRAMAAASLLAATENIEKATSVLESHPVARVLFASRILAPQVALRSLIAADGPLRTGAHVAEAILDKARLRLAGEGPPPQLTAFTVIGSKVRALREHDALEARSRAVDGDRPTAERSDAVRTLGWMGSRADTETLLDLLDCPEEAVADAAATALHVLTGRSPGGLVGGGPETGSAGLDLRQWWAVRRYALDIPVLIGTIGK